METFTLLDCWFMFFAGWLVGRGLGYIGNSPEGQINGRNPDPTYLKPPYPWPEPQARPKDRDIEAKPINNNK